MQNYISDSTISGKGLFAIKDYKKDDVVVDYRNVEGWYITKLNELTEYQTSHNWIIEIENNCCWTTDTLSDLNYMNHSRTPNCNWHIEEKFITAAKDISKGEELTIDYRIEKRSNRVSFPEWI